MPQTLLEVAGIGMLFESSAFFPILGVHILVGLVCVVTGIVTIASEKRAGLHPRCGTIYHRGLAVLVTSGGFLAAAHWTDDRLLLVLRGVSFGASSLGRTARRRHWQTWVGTHIISMGCSFIAMLTAFCVEEGKSLPGLSGSPRLTYWFLPALVGTPFIVRALVRHRLRYGVATRNQNRDSRVATPPTIRRTKRDFFLGGGLSAASRSAIDSLRSTRPDDSSGLAVSGHVARSAATPLHSALLANRELTQPGEPIHCGTVCSVIVYSVRIGPPQPNVLFQSLPQTLQASEFVCRKRDSRELRLKAPTYLPRLAWRSR